MRLYERAVALDSGFAIAWARLGSARSLLLHGARLGGQPMPVGVTPESARTAAERALALAPLRPEGYMALGEYFRSVEQSPSKTAEQIANGLRVAPDNPDLVTALGVLRYEAGEPDSALAPLQRAFALDPRSIFSAFWLGDVLLTTKRYSQAAEVFARARALAPLNLTALQRSVMAELGRGDLSAARAILREAPKELGDAKIAAYFAENDDLGWVLDEAGQRLLLSLGPGAFDRRLDWGLALAQAHALRGDTALMRAFADSARIAIERRLVATPNDAEMHALHGIALAYLGRFAEADREGALALEVNGTGARASRRESYLRHQLVRIKLLAGEREQALDLLEPLLKQSYWLSPGWVRVDPAFAPLHGHPRFERLVREG
jgi:tetratricopeptide (TPR) repeat protein